MQAEIPQSRKEEDGTPFAYIKNETVQTITFSHVRPERIPDLNKFFACFHKLKRVNFFGVALRQISLGIGDRASTANRRIRKEGFERIESLGAKMISRLPNLRELHFMGDLPEHLARLRWPSELIDEKRSKKPSDCFERIVKMLLRHQIAMEEWEGSGSGSASVVTSALKYCVRLEHLRLSHVEVTENSLAAIFRSLAKGEPDPKGSKGSSCVLTTRNCDWIVEENPLHIEDPLFIDPNPVRRGIRRGIITMKDVTDLPWRDALKLRQADQ